MRFLLLTSVALVFVGLVGCKNKDGDEHRSSASGRELYETYCQKCHGESGSGSFWKGTPPSRVTTLSRSEVADLIILGNEQHPKMPHFPKMSRADALQIALHLQDLAKRFGKQGPFWEEHIKNRIPKPDTSVNEHKAPH